MWAVLIMVAIAQPEPAALRVTLTPGTTCATTRDAVSTTLANASGLPDVLTVNGRRYRAEES